jgi:hypothetical protein
MPPRAKTKTDKTDGKPDEQSGSMGRSGSKGLVPSDTAPAVGVDRGEWNPGL